MSNLGFNLSPEINKKILPMLIIFFLFLPSQSACRNADDITIQIKKAVAALDEAIKDLGNESSDWQQLLRDLQSKLTTDAQKTIRDQVADVLNNGIAASGTELRCNADFFRVRSRQELINIKIKLIGGKAPDPVPTLCKAVPEAVDINRVNNNDLRVVNLYGYDFNTPDLRAYLSNGKDELDVTQSLAKPTHYQMTFNVGSNGIPLSAQSQKLILRWKGNDISTISVIQPTTTVCDEIEVPFTPGKVSLSPPHIKGDKDFDGNGPQVSAYVKLVNYRTHVDAEVYMEAIETKSDFTTAAGNKSTTIYTPPSGWVVDTINGPTMSYYAYIHGNSTMDTFYPGGPANIFEFTVNGDGDDAADNSRIDVSFGTIKFSITENTNCVSKQTLGKLKLLQQLSTGTFNTVNKAKTTMIVPNR